MPCGPDKGQAQYHAWYRHTVWSVKYLLAAAKEREELPARERLAIYNAVRKLEVLGPLLPAPHSSDARSAPGLRELRTGKPNGEGSPRRADRRSAGWETGNWNLKIKMMMKMKSKGNDQPWRSRTA